MNAISLPRRKEMAKEKTPRRSPWEPPGARKNCRRWRLQCFCEDKHIQILRWRLEVQAPTRKYHAINESKFSCCLLRTSVNKNFKQKTERNPCRGGVSPPAPQSLFTRRGASRCARNKREPPYKRQHKREDQGPPLPRKQHPLLSISAERVGKIGSTPFGR